MTESQKRKKRLFHRKLAKSISRYPACDHLNMALWYLLKNPAENRDAIGEIAYAISKSGGYIYDIHEEKLQEMGFKV